MDTVDIAGNATSGAQPDHAAYDTSNGYLYVPDYGTNNLTIIRDTDDAIIATLPVGDDPFGATYDSLNGLVYVANSGLTNNVTVVNGTQIEASVTVGQFDHLSTFDPDNGFVYVTNTGTNNVSILNGTAVIKDLPAGLGPYHSLFDPSNGWIYVMDAGGSEVVILNGTSTVANVSVGTNPFDGVFDSLNGYVYVSDSASNDVVVLNGSSVVGYVGVGTGPESPAFDPTNGLVYVPNAGTNNVTIINGSTVVATFPTGGSPVQAIYDPADGFVYVINRFSATVSVVNGTHLVATVTIGASPDSGIYDPSNDQLYVSEYISGNVSVIGTRTSPYGVTFNETGLSLGTNWTVGIGSTAYTAQVGSIAFAEPNGTFAFTVPPIPGFAAVESNGTVTISGDHPYIDLTFRPTYGVTFAESGLPLGTVWGVAVGFNVTQNSTATLTLDLINGSYTYHLLGVPGYTTTWSGPLTVSGLPQSVDVSFVVTRYTMTFQESGLPNGTLWSVSVQGQVENSSAASILYAVTNGTYSWAVTPIPGYSTSWFGATLVNGNDPEVDLVFREVTYLVMFTETGLPFATSWSVSADARSNTSTGTGLALYIPNGTFTYTVTPIPGYEANWTGSVQVNAARVGVSVAFTLVTYAVVFEESGLAQGTSWSVDLAGFVHTSTTSAVSFDQPNGSFGYFIPPVAGYVPTATGGNLSVNGTGSTLLVTFSARLYSVTFNERGLPPNTNWSVAIGAAGAASTSSTIEVPEPNGTFDYRVAGVPGYSTTWSGVVTVRGNNPTVTVSFVEVTYLVTFEESGLANDTNWNVTIDGAAHAATTSSLVVELPNGTFDFTVSSVPGYITPPTGSVSVAGASPAAVNLTFVPTPSPGGEGGGTTPLEIVGLVVVVVVAAVVAAVLLIRGRRRRSQPVEETAYAPSTPGGEEPTTGTRPLNRESDRRM